MKRNGGNMKRIEKLIGAVVFVTLLATTTFMAVRASDHDDGEMDLKGRAVNLTDLYAFTEDAQDSGGSSQNLVLIMNTNPRSLARQQYYFSSNARYEFHLSRIAAVGKAVAPKGKEDVTIRFEFGAPDSNHRQTITMSIIKDGQTITSSMGSTNALGDMLSGATPYTQKSINGQNVSVFAGLREDPFFFDVERYFRVRGYLATGVNTLTGPIQGGANVFRSTATAVDFTAGYNVNSIALRIPLALVQSAAQEPVFDVWETISVKK